MSTSVQELVAATAPSTFPDGPCYEPLESYLHLRAEWLSRLAFALTGERQACLDLLRETMLAGWRYYDWVSTVEDPERYVIQTLLHQFRAAGGVDDAVIKWSPLDDLAQRERAVVVLRYWAHFTDGRIADLLGCRKARVRGLAADAMRHAAQTSGSEVAITETRLRETLDRIDDHPPFRT